MSQCTCAVHSRAHGVNEASTQYSGHHHISSLQFGDESGLRPASAIPGRIGGRRPLSSRSGWPEKVHWECLGRSVFGSASRILKHCPTTCLWKEWHSSPLADSRLLFKSTGQVSNSRLATFAPTYSGPILFATDRGDPEMSVLIVQYDAGCG
jgi:hypothetical protein